MCKLQKFFSTTYAQKLSGTVETASLALEMRLNLLNLRCLTKCYPNEILLSQFLSKLTTNQKLLAGVVNCGCTDHPPKLPESRLHLYQLNFHCKQKWLLYYLSCVHSAVLYIPDSTITRAYIIMQEPRLSRTLHAPAVHTGTPTCL